MGEMMKGWMTNFVRCTSSDFMMDNRSVVFAYDPEFL
jgi:hypothetical protein